MGRTILSIGQTANISICILNLTMDLLSSVRLWGNCVTDTNNCETKAGQDNYNWPRAKAHGRYAKYTGTVT